MAIRFDASADRILRTSDLINYNSAYTWMAWVYLVSDLNDYGSIFGLNTNDNTGQDNEDWLGLDLDGTTLQVYVNNGGTHTSVNGTSLSTGTWYNITLVRESTSSIKAYLNGVLDITNTTSVTGRTAATRMESGAIYSTNEVRLNGRVAAIKAWSKALTQAQIQNEMYSVLPHDFNSVYGFYPTFPGATERLADYSGNGRNWTAGGTLTDEDSPPIVWGHKRTVIPLPNVSTPITVTANALTVISNAQHLALTNIVNMLMTTITRSITPQQSSVLPGGRSTPISSLALGTSIPQASIQKGVVQTNMSAITSHFSLPALAVSSIVNIIATTLSRATSAVTVDVQKGVVIMTVNSLAVTFIIDGLSVTSFAAALMDTLQTTVSSAHFDLHSPTSLPFDSLSLTFTPSAISPHNQTDVQLTSLTMTISGQNTVVTPGAAAALFNTVGLALHPNGLTISAQVRQLMDNLIMALDTQPTAINAGEVAITTSSLTISNTGISLEVSTGGVAVAFGTLNMAVVGVDTNVVAGLFTIFDTLTLALQPDDMAIIHGPVSTTITPLTITVRAENMAVNSQVKATMSVLSSLIGAENLTVLTNGVISLDTLGLTSLLAHATVSPGAVLAAISALMVQVQGEITDVAASSRANMTSVNLASAIPTLQLVTGGSFTLMHTLTLLGLPVTFVVRLQSAKRLVDVVVGDTTIFSAEVTVTNMFNTEIQDSLIYSIDSDDS